LPYRKLQICWGEPSCATASRRALERITSRPSQVRAFVQIHYTIKPGNDALGAFNSIRRAHEWTSLALQSTAWASSNLIVSRPIPTGNREHLSPLVEFVGLALVISPLCFSCLLCDLSEQPGAKSISGDMQTMPITCPC
jgi:hypothetical protein